MAFGPDAIQEIKQELLLDEAYLFWDLPSSSHCVEIMRFDFPFGGAVWVPAFDEQHARMLAIRMARHCQCDTRVWTVNPSRNTRYVVVAYSRVDLAKTYLSP